MMRYLVLAIAISTFLTNCAVGHESWVKYKNESIGKKAVFLDPTRFGNAGMLIRGNFLISGQGFTHITIAKNGDIIQHWDLSEVLPIYADSDSAWASGKKELVGKCLVYYVVDPVTDIVKSWGFDEGGNPQSCQIWQ